MTEGPALRYPVPPRRGPRICSHRGLSAVMPENTPPAFAAAVACGTDEIEFDLWLSRDGVPVVCHDPDLRRVAGADLRVTAADWKEIRRLDAGFHRDPAWQGVRITRFEEVLDVAAGRTVLNIHIKDPGPDDALVRLVCGAIRGRGLADSAYIAGDAAVLDAALRLDPAVLRCCLDRQDTPAAQLESALKRRCFRAQLYRSVTEEEIRSFHGAGIGCNLFWADAVEEAEAWHRRGIDVVLTNRGHVLLDQFRDAPYFDCRLP